MNPHRPVGLASTCSNSWRARAAGVLFLGVLATGAVRPAAAQEDLKTLLRDQEEILRKSERLRDLMQRLLVRYEKEGRVEQVNLLRSGLQHLEQSGLVEDV